MIVRKYTRLSPGSFIVEFLKNKLESAHISIYLFNITNAEDFMSGKDHRLKIEEVGPFTYREILMIENLELDEVAGEMRYSPRFDLEYVLEESIGKPEDFNVTMPNLPYLGIASMISSYPYFIRMAFNVMVRQLTLKPLTNLNAKNFFWGAPSDPFVRIARTLAPEVFDYNGFGIFDIFYNRTKPDLVVGATDKDKFMVKTQNGHKKLMLTPLHGIETCTKCASFENVYEGMMYPSPVRPDTPIKLFRTDICKTVDFVFHEKRVLNNGVEGLVFHINDSFYSLGSIRGLVDMSDCYYGFPGYLSKVHLEDVDSELYKRIDGIKPDPDKYKSYIMIEPITGVEIDTYVTAQMNMILTDLSFNSEAKRLSNIMLPTFYAVVRQPELPQIVSTVLKILYVTLPLILLITRVVLFLVAFILLTYSSLLVRSKKRSYKNVTYFPNTNKIDEKNCDIKVQEPLVVS